MKRFLIAISLLGGALCAPAFAADVGVSVSIGQPGFYGQIDIGGFPRPAVIYPQPVVVQPVPVMGPPVYLHVPPGHAKHWNKHCYQYGACGQQVYFVRDNWYNREYVPRYRERHGDRRDWDDRGRDDGRGHGHGHYR
ncbi:MAG: hypothetical protein ACM3SV_10070 [Betaproteobacteria bacterium]